MNVKCEYGKIENIIKKHILSFRILNIFGYESELIMAY